MKPNPCGFYLSLSRTHFRGKSHWQACLCEEIGLLLTQRSEVYVELGRIPGDPSGGDAWGKDTAKGGCVSLP